MLAGEAVRAKIALAAEASGNAEVFLTGIARAMAADLEKSDFCNGCPIATTALETAAQSEVLARRRARARSKAGSRKWRAGWSVSAQSPTTRRLQPPPSSARSKARCLLARTYRSVEPLRRAEAAVKLLAKITR